MASGTAIADVLHPVDRLPELADPVVLVVTDQADAPGERLAAAAGDAAVDEGVEHLTLLEAKPGHGRSVDGGEVRLGLATPCAPADGATERLLGLVGDRHALLAGRFAEGDDLLFVGEPGAGRSEVADDEDLVGVVADAGDLGEPSVGQRIGEPRREGLGVGGRRCRGPVAPGAWGRWWLHGKTRHPSEL